MFGKTGKEQKNEQSAAKDEHVLKESQQDLQPMGNEAANVDHYTNMLREANADNMLDISDEIIQEVENPNLLKNVKDLIKHPGADDLNNSMYLESSHNIVNDNNFINGINVNDLRSSVGKKKDDKEKEEFGGCFDGGYVSRFVFGMFGRTGG